MCYTYRYVEMSPFKDLCCVAVLHTQCKCVHSFSPFKVVEGKISFMRPKRCFHSYCVGHSVLLPDGFNSDSSFYCKIIPLPQKTAVSTIQVFKYTPASVVSFMPGNTITRCHSNNLRTSNQCQLQTEPA